MSDNEIKAVIERPEHSALLDAVYESWGHWQHGRHLDKVLGVMRVVAGVEIMSGSVEAGREVLELHDIMEANMNTTITSRPIVSEGNVINFPTPSTDTVH